MSSYTCNPTVQPKENFNNYYEDEEYDEEYDDGEFYPNGVPAYPYEDFAQDQVENFESQSGWGPAQLSTDAPNNDITSMGVANGQACMDACAQESGCNGIVTNAAGNYCWLKSSIGQTNSNSDRVTYTYSKPAPAPGTSAAPPLSPNDFTFIGIGRDYNLYVQDVIGGVWNPACSIVQNSGSVLDVAVFPNGSLIAVGTDNNLYTRQTLNSAWVNSKIDGVWGSVSIANDGKTLLLVGKDRNIYTFDTSNYNNRMPATMVLKAEVALKVIQMQNSIYLVILAIGNKADLFTTPSLTTTFSQWTPVEIGSNTLEFISVAQAPSGKIYGVNLPDGSIYSGNSWTNWTSLQVTAFIGMTIMPIPPQNINGYDRKGAFVDDSSRTIPNFLGNVNTLSECINTAQSQGYNTVGYQYMTQCWGGNNSPYDRVGFQKDNTKSVSAYPGAMTNIVYKTGQDLLASGDPAEGEVFIYQACQFGGAGSKMTVGQYPTIDSTEIKSLKIGPNTKITFYSSSNFQGNSNLFFGNSDVVNKDSTCVDVAFSSAKVEKYPNAMPAKPSDLTNAQLANLWTQAGCKAESLGFNATNISNWKSKSTIRDVVTDMKSWATSNDASMKQGCNTLAPQPDVPSEGEIVLFENANFAGRYKKFGMGNVSFVGNDFNDITSSIKIGPYTSVTIYENPNYGGRSLNWKNDSGSVSVINDLSTVNFNDILSSLKVTSSTAQVNFNLALQASPISVLGPWNTAPWNMSNFADQSAQWIWWNNWNGQFPNGSAPIDSKPVRFQLLVPISGNRDVPVVINVVADNAPQGANFVKVNGKLVGQITDGAWTTPNYTQIETSLAPGNNLLEFDVQNMGGGAGLLVSVINSNTYEVVANSGSGQWGWVDPSKVVSSILSEEVGSDFVIHDEAAKGKVVKFKNLNEIPMMTVGGTFRLSVNLTSVPPYIKGQQYKTGDTNQFYLSIEKLDPNCQVQDSGKCMNVYVDNKKCDNATLSNVSRTNAYRLVLVSKAYVLDPDIPFGKNVDFTLVKVGEKIYLKNVQTGYMPKLFVNDYKQQLYGYMDTSYLSNINSLKSNQNKLCGANAVAPPPSEESNPSVGNILGKAMGGLFGSSEQAGAKANQKFVNCSTNADGSMYMMTTTNLVESNPIKFVLNKDGTINIRLQQFNTYGNIDKTFSLVSCNFNVNTYAFIEKLTNPLGTFLINMVCFDPDDKRQLPNNTLNFSVEISKYPDSYLKDKNIYNLNV
jgi:hypothetical protein